MSSPSPLLDMWHNNLAGDPMLSKSDVKSACTDSSVQRIWRILSTRTVGPLCVGPTPISQSVLSAGPEVIVFDEPQAPGVRNLAGGCCRNRRSEMCRNPRRHRAPRQCVDVIALGYFLVEATPGRPASMLTNGTPGSASHAGDPRLIPASLGLCDQDGLGIEA